MLRDLDDIVYSVEITYRKLIENLDNHLKNTGDHVLWSEVSEETWDVIDGWVKHVGYDECCLPGLVDFCKEEGHPIPMSKGVGNE